MPTSSRAAAHAPWPFVVLLSAMTAVGPLSIDMYLPSLPTIASDLQTDMEAAQSTVAIFLIGMAVGQLFYGPASDRVGRRVPILAGLALFVAGSIASALAPDVTVLLAARLAQALGACASMVIGRAVVRDHFDHQESARFFSLLALVTGAAPILAPIAGGVLLNVIGWRGIFGVLATFGMVLGLCVMFGLRESRSEAVARHARAEHPFRSYLALLGERRLLGYLAAGALNSAAMFAYIASSPAAFIGVFGVSPATFGVLFGINAVGLIAASQLNRILLRRYAADQVLAAAAIGSATAATVLVCAALSQAGGLFGIVLPLFLTACSASLIQANAIAGALSVDPLRAGSTSALFGAGSFTAGALAASISGALYDGTVRPMAFVIAFCLVGSAITIRGVAVRR